MHDRDVLRELVRHVNWANHEMVAACLFQAATHATEHRQQIATALTVHGVAPPEPDLWAYWRTARR